MKRKLFLLMFIASILLFFGSTNAQEPDIDGDGIEDTEDACPAVPGAAADKGCPAAEADDRCLVSPLGVQNVLIREQPSLESRSIGRILPGLFYEAESRVQTESGYWYQVGSGWVAAFVTAQRGNCAILDPTPTPTPTETSAPATSLPTEPATTESPPLPTVTVTPSAAASATFTIAPPTPTATPTASPTSVPTMTPIPVENTAAPSPSPTATGIPDAAATADPMQNLSPAGAEILTDAIAEVFMGQPFLEVGSPEFALAVQAALPESHPLKFVNPSVVQDIINKVLVCADDEPPGPGIEPVLCHPLARMNTRDLQEFIVILQSVFFTEYTLAVDSIEFAAAVQRQLRAEHPVNSTTPEILSTLIPVLIRCEGADANFDCDPAYREAESSNPPMNARSLGAVVQEFRTSENGALFDWLRLRDALVALAGGG